MYSLSQQVLRTDASGIPLEWIDFREAVRIYHLDQVVFALGKPLYQIRGGHNAISGRRSIIQVNSIVGTHGDSRALLKSRAHYIPPLNNQTLFARDVRLCMYCGDQHSVRGLSRDHILPLSRGGTDTWNNVVTACKRCNNRKAGRTPSGPAWNCWRCRSRRRTPNTFICKASASLPTRWNFCWRISRARVPCMLVLTKQAEGLEHRRH